MYCLKPIQLGAALRLILPVLIGTLGAAHALANPISAYVGAQATVNYYFEPGHITVAQDNQSWTGTPSSLNANAVATGTSDNGSTATTYNHSAATWAGDGNSGTVTVDYGWSANTHDVATAVGTGSIDPLYALAWSYTFTADTSGLFVMNASIVGTGSSPDPSVIYPMFGLMGFDIIGTAFMPLGVNSIDPTVSGTITQWLDQGQTYTMILRNGGNVSGGLGVRDANLHAEFNWSLPGATAVPETASSVVLLLVGLAALTGLARVRRVLG